MPESRVYKSSKTETKPKVNKTTYRVNDMSSESLDQHESYKINGECYQVPKPKKSHCQNSFKEESNQDLLNESNTCPVHRSVLINGNSKQLAKNFTSNHPSSTKACPVNSWSILPVILILTTTIGLLITFILAKNNCHIQKFIWPYVSYTGTEHPEYMIFGLIMNLEGFLGSVVVFLAWRYYRHMGQRGWLNRLALICGWFSCFGVVMVGNFQVTKAKVPHYVGAGFAFIGGTGYGVLAAVLSRKAFRAAKPKLRWGSCMSTVRIVFAIFMVVTLACMTAAGIIKVLSNQNKSSNHKNFTLTRNENGSCEDLLSKIPPEDQFNNLFAAVTEWLLTFLLLICLFLFAYEFQTFQNVKVVLLKHGGPLQCNKSVSRKGTDSSYVERFNLTSNSTQVTELTRCDRTADQVSSYCFRCGSSSDYEHLSKVLLSDATSCPLVKERTAANADSGIEDEVTHHHVNDVNANKR